MDSQMIGAIGDADATWTTFTRSRFSRVTPGSRQISSQTADAELLSIEKSVFLARVLRNETIPINTLPPEVLLDIFLHIRDSSVDNTRFWMCACTHICHRFRVIALSSHVLWTRLSDERYASSKLVKALVPRAGSLPTQIDLRLQDSNERTKVLQIAHDFELNHVESLKLNVVGNVSNGQLFSVLFEAPMPLLKRLCIDFSPRDDVLWRAPTSVSHALEALHFKFTAFDWSSSIYDNLVELRLDGMASRRCAPKVADLQNLFRRMHRVTSITLKHIILVDKASCIKLPDSLEDFSVLDSYDLRIDSVAFAPNPSLSKVTLEVSLDCFDKNKPDTLAVSPTIQHWSCLWKGDTQNFVELSLLADQSAIAFKVAMYRDTPLCDETPQYPTTTTATTAESPIFSYSRYLEGHLDISKCLESMYPSVSGLRLAAPGFKDHGHGHGFTSATWHQIFAKLDGLRTFVLTKGSLSSVLPCLVENPAYLPRLKVFMVVPNSREEAGYASDLDKIGHVHVVWLTQWREARKKAGVSGPCKLMLPTSLRDSTPGI